MKTDQPKSEIRRGEPATEWTADRIYSYGVSDADFGVRLAKDINAALAAEREKRESIESINKSLAKAVDQLSSQRDEAIRLLHYRTEEQKPIVVKEGK